MNRVLKTTIEMCHLKAVNIVVHTLKVYRQMLQCLADPTVLYIAIHKLFTGKILIILIIILIITTYDNNDDKNIVVHRA